MQAPAEIEAFFQAHNTGQTGGFGDLFTADAVVRDEEREHRGEAIRAWIDEAIASYRPVAEILSIVEESGRTVALATVSGDFSGSPIELRYRFTLADGRISALDIGA